MRQAGRYLPEYRAVRERVDFLALCKTPELAARVSLQPVERFGVDVCIIFSDILIPVEAMGAPIEFGDAGPRLARPIRTLADIERLHVPDPETETPFVMAALRRTREALGDRAALVGFSGAPFTLASYLVEGGGSKNFSAIKTMMYAEPSALHALLAKLSDAVSEYVAAQVAARAPAIQIFDTWAGELEPRAHERFAMPYQAAIVERLKRSGVPAIPYVNNCSPILERMAGTCADVLRGARRGDSIAVNGCCLTVADLVDFIEYFILDKATKAIVLYAEDIRRPNEFLAVAKKARAAGKPSAINIDWTTYNPVSMVLKEKGLLEKEFAKDGIGIRWVQTLGSNKALEFLNAGSIDFGSTAGSAALLGRINGNPIKSIYVYSKPEWTALVTRKDTPIQHITDLKGKRVAVTRGTDPHIFLVRALLSAGLTEKDISEVLLQHPDGKTALIRGDVDAWAGLDPMMAQAEIEDGAKLFFRKPEANTWGILNVREQFLTDHPDIVRRVLATYEAARKYSLANYDELKKTFVAVTKLPDTVVDKQLKERTELTHNRIGAPQRDSILAAGLALPTCRLRSFTSTTGLLYLAMIALLPGQLVGQLLLFVAASA